MKRFFFVCAMVALLIPTYAGAFNGSDTGLALTLKWNHEQAEQARQTAQFAALDAALAKAMTPVDKKNKAKKK